jgi:hypothetical protein
MSLAHERSIGTNPDHPNRVHRVLAKTYRTEVYVKSRFASLGIICGLALSAGPVTTTQAASSLSIGGAACVIESRSPPAHPADLSYSDVAGVQVAFRAGGPRHIICPVPRISALSAGNVTVFVNGYNNNGSIVRCTLTVRNSVGTLKHLGSFETSATNFNVPINLPSTTFSAFDYSNLVCELPMGNAGLRGVTIFES